MVTVFPLEDQHCVRLHVPRQVRRKPSTVCITDPLSCFGLHRTVISSCHPWSPAPPLNRSYQSVRPIPTERSKHESLPLQSGLSVSRLSYIAEAHLSQPPTPVPPGAPHIHSGAHPDGMPFLDPEWGVPPVQQPALCPALHRAEFARGRKCQSTLAGR